jgi:hypothetical protein
MRWSSVFEVWMLEEKISYKRTVDPSRYPSTAHDSFVRFSDGFCLKDEFHPKRLPSVDRLITGIRQGDPERIMAELGVKNASQWAAALDYRDRKRLEAKWLKDKERGREYAGEFYDDLAWLEGRTVGSYAGQAR